MLREFKPFSSGNYKFMYSPDALRRLGIIISMVDYFKGQKPKEFNEKRDGFSVNIDQTLVTKFCDKIMSSPKQLLENYDEKSDTYILVMEEMINGEVVNNVLTVKIEDVKILKKANDMIINLDFPDINFVGQKAMVQMDVAIKLKSGIFQKLIGHTNVLDIAHLHLMKGVILYIYSKEETTMESALSHICNFLQILINNYCVDEPCYQYLFFEALDFAEDCYHSLNQSACSKDDSIESGVFDKMYQTSTTIVRNFIQLHDSSFIGEKLQIILIHFEMKIQINDYEGAEKDYQNGFNYLESIRKSLRKNDFNEWKFHFMYFIIKCQFKREQFREALETIYVSLKLNPCGRLILYRTCNVACLCCLELDEIEKARHYGKKWIQIVLSMKEQSMKLRPFIFMVALHNGKHQQKMMLKYANCIMEPKLDHTSWSTVFRTDPPIMKLFFSALKVPIDKNKRRSRKRWRLFKLSSYVNTKIAMNFM